MFHVRDTKTSVILDTFCETSYSAQRLLERGLPSETDAGVSTTAGYLQVKEPWSDENL